MVISIENFTVSLSSEDVDMLEQSLVSVYNTMSGGCDDPFRRFMDEANIDSQTPLEPSAGSGIGLDAVRFTWDVQISCHGCPSCLLYTSPSPRDLSTSRMPSSA